MNKFVMKFGNIIASLALAATISLTSICIWVAYQPELPEGAEKLKKF